MSRRLRKERRQTCLICAAIAAGRHVVVDNTNATALDRSRLVFLGRMLGARVVCYWVDEPIGESIARNRQRSGRHRVPDVGIFGTIKRFQPPHPREGYDDMWRVTHDGEGGFRVRPMHR